MSIVKNTEIENLNKKLSTIDPSTLSKLGQENQNSLTILLSRISGVLSSAGADKWDCNVRSTIQTFIDGPFKTLVDKATQSSQLVADAATPVNNLKTVCNEYITEFNNYETELKKTYQQYNQVVDNNGATTSVLNQDYVDWSKRITAYETALPQLEEEVLRLKAAVISYFQAVDFTTNTVDASKYTAGSTNIKTNYANIVKAIESIPNSEYIPKYKSEWVQEKDDPTKYNCKEEASTDTDTQDGGHYKGDKTTETKAEDINGDGKIDEQDALINQKVHEEGTYTAPDGTEYGYVGDKELDKIGIVTASATVTNKETEKEVYKMEEERVVAYTDPDVGMNVVENTKVEKTEETTTETRTVDSSLTNGENQVVQTRTIETKNEDEQVGIYTDEDGYITEVYRDENNNLKARDKYPDGSLIAEYDVEDETKTFTIKYPDGHTESMKVNPNNPLDKQKMKNKYQNIKNQFDHSGDIDPGFVNMMEFGDPLTIYDYNYENLSCAYEFSVE